MNTSYLGFSIKINLQEIREAVTNISEDFVPVVWMLRIQCMLAYGVPVAKMNVM